MRSVPHFLDLASRSFWRLAGRRVDLAGAEHWLDAPVSSYPRVRNDWIGTEVARHGGVVGEPDPDAGLLPSMSVLDGPGFAAERLDPMVRDFYEHTARWRLLPEPGSWVLGSARTGDTASASSFRS